MTSEEKYELIGFLGEYITESRRELIDEKLNLRTRYITVVLEDIYDPHNASAVMRSCECFGIQDIHVVEQRNSYELSKSVTKGSSKWITLHRYNEPGADNIKNCYEVLRSKGYRILAASSDPGASSLREYKLKSPVALVFGTEFAGLTEYARTNADEFIHIPMQGFTESFNISVSAGICLYELAGKMHNSSLEWQLSETQKVDLKLEWYRSVIKRSESLEKEFFKQK